MPDQTNADGTKQVSPPTRSAFAQDSADQKAAAKPAAPAANQDNSDHEGGLINAIKGMIRQHSGLGSVNKNENNALHALDHGASEAPGNNADY